MKFDEVYIFPVCSFASSHLLCNIFLVIVNIDEIDIKEILKDQDQVREGTGVSDGSRATAATPSSKPQPGKHLAVNEIYSLWSHCLWGRVFSRISFGCSAEWLSYETYPLSCLGEHSRCGCLWAYWCSPNVTITNHRGLPPFTDSIKLERMQGIFGEWSGARMMRTKCRSFAKLESPVCVTASVRDK